MNMTSILLSASVFFPIAAGIVSYLIGRGSKNTRDSFVQIVSVLELVLMLGIALSGSNGSAELPGICGFGLHFTADGFRVLYGLLTAFMWLSAAVFCKEYMARSRNRNRFYLFFLLTLGAAQGIFLSADLYTTFIFFEMMSFTSYVWVAQEESEEALHAGATYLGAAVIGGMTTLMGLFLLYQQTGTLVIDELYAACQGKSVYLSAVLIFLGFGVKAGTFPLHITLPKAYPAAPAPASALLSAILSKNGLFGILVITCQILLHDALWGTVVLIVGVLTMAVGAVLALFSINIKHTLACSSVSQIGFILVGIGMQGLLGEENALAVQGTFLHMLNHSLFKMVLFTIAGIVFMNAGKLNLNEIRGFGRGKPMLAAAFLCAALGIGGIPLFSGYISKTLLHESIVEYIALLGEGHLSPLLLTMPAMKAIEWIFLISGGLTVAYMSKLFIAVFLQKNTDTKVQASYDAMNGRYLSKKSSVLLMLTALVIPILGILPHWTMDRAAEFAKDFFRLEHIHVVSYFSFVNLRGACVSIGIGAIVYVLFVRKCMAKTGTYRNLWPEVLDLENLIYRPILLKLLPTVCGGFCFVLDNIFDVGSKILTALGCVTASILDNFVDSIVVLLRRTIYKDSPVPREPEEGNVVTEFFGKLVNRMVWLLNRTVWRKKTNTTDYVHRYALAYESFKENTSLIGRSLSYGLILFCFGLLMTLIYLFAVLASHGLSF